MQNMDNFNKEYLTKEELIKYLNVLNEELKVRDVKGDIALYGGAVMCLVFNTRGFTKDIDAIFEPRVDMRKIIKEIAEDNNLSEDWLNDGVKGFISNNNDLVLFKQLSHLAIYHASAEYMLAMKVLSSRVGYSKDIEDIKSLLEILGIKSLTEAEKIVLKYYPVTRIPQKAFYLLEELFDGL